MTATRTAHTVWDGNLMEGHGQVAFDSSKIGEYPVSWPARTEEPNGKTSPEELIAAAHSACYSMSFSHALAKAGTPPTRLTTQADVTFTPGTGITGVHLTVSGQVPGIDEQQFIAIAQDAKQNCPVSKALAGTTITLDATLD